MALPLGGGTGWTVKTVRPFHHFQREHSESECTI
jgi:hypothetical protein